MAPAADDRGETLLEVIISIMIIGLAVAAVLGGIAAGSTLTSAHRGLSVADVTAKGRVEAVKRLPYDSTATTAGSTYKTVVETVPSGFTGTLSRVQCLPAAYTTAVDVSDALAAPACSGTNDHGVQVLTIVIDRTGGTATERVAFIKRRPS